MAVHVSVIRPFPISNQPAEWGPTVILRGNNHQDRMSALGPKADIVGHQRDVRFTPKTGHSNL
jgi:hypothetical protein